MVFLSRRKTQIMNGSTEAKEKTTLGQRKEPKDNHMQQKLTNLYILGITKMQT